MIEYLLVLTLTVALVLAVSKGVGKPMQDYLQSNVLDLVGCMLRVGQFPTKSFGLCQQAIQVKMDVAANYGDSGNGNSGSSSANSNESSNSADRNNGNDKNNNANRSNSARVRSNTSTGSLNESGGGSELGDGSKKIKISNDDSSGNNSFSIGINNLGTTTVIVRRIKREDGRVGGSFFIKENKSSKNDGSENYQAMKSQKTPKSEFDRTPTGLKFSIPKNGRNGQVTSKDDENVDFSFLGMIKWILIIVALFFIVVFAASQLNSIRKGWTD